MKNMKNMKNILFILLLLLLVLLVLFFNDKYKKKTVTIFGGVSKDISDDLNLQKELKNLALNLNTTKYDYVIPNSKKGPIGYILNNIKEEDKSSVITTYSTTFGENNMNETFKIKMFNDPVDFEEYMIENSNIFIILPGGIGTLYEIAFLLFLIDVSPVNNKIIFYNKNNYYDFIDNIMKKYNKNGYLRDNIYDKYKSTTYFVDNIEDINKLIN
jgi:predicted Rossmann-fold nucleotide-binding protein